MCVSRFSLSVLFLVCYDKNRFVLWSRQDGVLGLTKLGDRRNVRNY